MKGYTVIPNEVLMDHRLSSDAVRLYAILVRRIGKKEYCWPSREHLAKDLNCSVSTIVRVTKELVNCGYIFTSSMNIGGKTTKRYFIEQRVTTDTQQRVTTDTLNNTKYKKRASVSEVALSSTSDEPQIRI